MKKSKDRGTPTVAQDKAFQEKLELVKVSSLFVERIIRYYNIKEDCSDFILNCFQRLLLSFPITPAKADSVEKVCGWPSRPSLKEAVQPMSQEKMEELWKSIEEYIQTCDIGDNEYTLIDFEKGTLVWSGSPVPFLDACIEIAPVSTDPLKGTHEAFDLHAYDRLRGAVYLVDQWNEDWPMRGLLKTIDEDGHTFFVELQHFSMMTHALPCNINNRHPQFAFQVSEPCKVAATGEGTKSKTVSTPKECTETINPNMFIVFDKPRQVLWGLGH